MIGDIVRGAVKAAGGWVGSLIAGEPGRAVGSKLTESLLTKLPGDDSGFEPINTMVQPQRFGGRMGFARARRAMTTNKAYTAPTVNAESLYAAWDNRLNRYYSSAYKIKRTVTSLNA